MIYVMDMAFRNLSICTMLINVSRKERVAISENAFHIYKGYL